MAQITIDLTERQERFLKEFAAKHYSGSHANVLTSKPIHFVQTRRERVVDPDYESPDKTSYVVPDWVEDYDSPHELVEAYYSDDRDDECPIPIVSFDEAYEMAEFIGVDGEEHVILDKKDYFEAYGIPSNLYCEVAVAYYWDIVAVFFILDAAKEYMKYQSHNLTAPRTYTVGAGYANKGEYEDFWDLLFKMGCQLSEQS